MFKNDTNDKYVIVESNSKGEIVRIIKIETYEKLIDSLDSMTGYDIRENRVTYADFNLSGVDTREYTNTFRETYFDEELGYERYRVRYHKEIGYRKYCVYIDLGNGYGRRIDIRDFEKDIKKHRDERIEKYRNNYDFYDRDSAGEYITGESYFKYRWSKNYEQYKFRRGPVPGVGGRYHYRRTFRRPKLIHNIRLITDPEYTEYTRKTSILSLGEYWWDDFPRSLDRCWKSSRKCRKQWQKNKAA